MAGIFGNLFGGAQQPQQPGVLGQQAQQPLGFANDARWTALGSALLGGRSWSDAGAQFGQALPGAMVANTAFRKDARAEQERLGQNAAWSAAFKKMSGVPTTPDEDAALARFPEIGIKTLPDKPTPHSDIAQVNADFASGLITQAQRDQQIASASGGAFEGNALDNQELQIILKGQTDPAYRETPEFKIAWSHQYEEPKYVSGSDANGKMILTPILPKIPPGLIGPTTPLAEPAPTVPEPAAAPGAETSAAGNVGTGEQRTDKPIVTGDVKLTEQQLRQRQIYSILLPEMKTINDNWSALNDLPNQLAKASLGGELGLDNLLTSPEYQKAYNATRSSISQVLYSLSGANANPGEVENQTDNLMPKPFEGKEATDAKLERIRTMVESTRIAGGPGAPTDPAATEGPVDWETYFKVQP